MAAVMDALLDAKGLRPRPVTWAAVLGALAGGLALAASSVLFEALFGPGGAAVWVVRLVWLVAVTQVVGAVLLIVGGVRLALGAGRRLLVAGAALQVLVSVAYLLYALTAVAADPDEPGETVAAFVIAAAVFAAGPLGSAVLALSPTTSAYLAGGPAAGS